MGPVAGAMLGDLGAEVIHVENRLTGDPARGLMEARLPSGKSSYFEYNNHGKKSITVDLNKKKGQEVIHRLAKGSDVFMHNFRQGVPERLNLGYETLSRHNRKLIYAALSGYGPEGPEAGEPAFDYLGLARCGIMFLAGEPDMPPLNIRRGIADQVGAIMSAYGIVAALLVRERSGIGQKLDVSFLGSMMTLEGEAIGMWLNGTDTPRTNRKKAPNPLWNHYECKDGTWLALAMLQADKYWPTLCKGMGLGHLVKDARFENMAKRRENCEELLRIMNGVFLTRTAKEWVAVLKEAGDIICTPVQTIKDLVNDPQVLANDYITNYNHLTLGKVKALGLPIRFNKTPGAVKWEAPEFGQNTEEVLLELGYSWPDINALREEEII